MDAAHLLRTMSWYHYYINVYPQKADLSIFVYLNHWKDIEVGAKINAWVRRIQKRNNSQVNLPCFKNFMELYLNRHNEKGNDVKLGVVEDSIKIPESVMKVY